MGIRHRLSRPSKKSLKEVALPGHGVVRLNKLLDFVGDNCLRTILITKLTLNKAAPGTVLEICSDNLSAIETIPFMLQQCNCDHLATINDVDCHRIYLRKRFDDPEASQPAVRDDEGYTGRETGK